MCHHTRESPSYQDKRDYRTETVTVVVFFRYILLILDVTEAVRSLQEGEVKVTVYIMVGEKKRMLCVVEEDGITLEEQSYS